MLRVGKRSLRAYNAIFTVPGASAPVSSCLLSISTLLMEQLLAFSAGELLIFGIGGSRIQSLLAGFTVEGVGLDLVIDGINFSSMLHCMVAGEGFEKVGDKPDWRGYTSSHQM